MFPHEWEPSQTPPERRLEVDVRTDGEVVTVTAIGNLDVYTATAMRERLEHVDVTWGSVCIDVGGVRLVDSLGLAALVSIANRAQRHDRKIRLRCGPQLVELLEIAGLAGVFVLDPPLVTAVPSAA